MRTLIYRFNSISLRRRLLLIFVLLIIIPLLLQGFVSLSILSDSVMSRYMSEMDYRFLQLRKLTDSLFSECGEVLFRFAYEKDIQDIMEGKDQSESLVQSRYVIESLLRDGRLNSGIAYSIFVYDLRGNCYTNDYIDMLAYGDVKDEIRSESHLFSNIILSDLMRRQNYASIIIGRPLFGYSGKSRIGSIVIRIDARHLKNLYGNAFEGTDAELAIVDDKGVIVSSDVWRPGGRFEDHTGIDIMNAGERSITVRDRVVFLSSPDERGWTFVSAVDQRAINKARNELQLTLWILIFAVLVLIILVIVYITKRVVWPINKLTHSIEAVESAEEAGFTFMPKYDDEIGKLAQTYNNMTIKLRTSVERIKEVETQKQRAELKMFESQINPHFLYNTLASIIWLIHKDKKEESIDMLDALARLYQISVNGGKAFITVEDEFQHVRSYLIIQEKRYRGEFTWKLELEPSARDLLIIKVLLQPLVENAISHGLRERDRRGEILVRAERADSRLVLEVRDNGGMTPEMCRAINESLEGTAEKSCLGVGLSNVMARLRLFYGGNCSMRFFLQDGFTVARIEIIIDEREEESCTRS